MSERHVTEWGVRYVTADDTWVSLIGEGALAERQARGLAEISTDDATRTVVNRRVTYVTWEDAS